MARNIITAERLRELMVYEPETGFFRWRATNSNRAVAGSIAGSKSTKYCHIKIDGERYYAHRLAFLYMTGQWPTALVDHINLDKLDNRWSNLRLASYSENSANSSVTLSAVGFKGVRKTKYGRFQARIKVHGLNCHIGTYPTAELAFEAYKVAAAAAFGNFSRVHLLTANKE